MYIVSDIFRISGATDAWKQRHRDVARIDLEVSSEVIHILLVEYGSGPIPVPPH